jgi:acyl carrier protein
VVALARRLISGIDTLEETGKNTLPISKDTLPMNKAEAVIIVTDVLTAIQEISGRERTSISESTCPIGDLAQFDSLNGVEATVELSDRLGIDLPSVNALVNESGTKALTVSEIADGICKLTGGKEPLR